MNRIDEAALAFAHRVIARQPQANFLSNILGGTEGLLSGATYDANNTGNYYQQALNKLISSTGSGSPAAQTFSNEEVAALKPLFKTQNQNMADQDASLGITESGAAKKGYSDLASNQSAALAGNIAPLYSQALGAYGNIAAAEPGAQSGVYQNATDQFNQAAYGLLTGQPQQADPYNPYGPDSGGGGGGDGGEGDVSAADAYGEYPDGTAGG
jgi:hypothetical protein